MFKLEQTPAAEATEERLAEYYRTYLDQIEPDFQGFLKYLSTEEKFLNMLSNNKEVLELVRIWRVKALSRQIRQLYGWGESVGIELPHVES